MPRPKKPGAPEPKKRSRSGCWPCKTRKVKCDETRPTCLNCQRQSETCDYSIRLNWDGRSKKKDSIATAAAGELSFSALSEPSWPNTVAPNTTASAGKNSQTVIDFSDPRSATNGSRWGGPVVVPQLPQIAHPVELTSHPSFVPDNSMIDPALICAINSPTFHDELYTGARSEQQYTQSYERYHAPTSTFTQPSSQDRTQDLQNPGEPEPTTPLSGVKAKSFPPGSSSEYAASAPRFRDKDDGETSSTEDLERPPKRARYPDGQTSSYDTTMPPPNVGPYVAYSPESQTSSSFMTASNVSSIPPTAVSNHHGDQLKSMPNMPTESLERRRLSVSSLLSGPSSGHYQDSSSDSNRGAHDWYQENATYGIDRGFKDLDIGQNDDANALSGSSSNSPQEDNSFRPVVDDATSPLEFGFGMEAINTAFENGAYYDKPVVVTIPKALEPLPSILLESPMNLLYFHHFLNHTAGCLIPHNCSSNPFKTVLPRMAVKDDNLMKLLLAYSASHRARHLGQPEPASRIALWVQGIFPTLRHALDQPDEIISDANLATTIMLASLEIISPKAFGVEVPWQTHLSTARQMIAARGGPRRMRTASRHDQVSSFLWGWFAYLDVLGSLSGDNSNPASSAWVLDYETDADSFYSIDCILGFTSRCIYILAKIAELSRICDSSRIGPDHTIRENWRPSADVVSRAEKLEADLADSRSRNAQPCLHLQSTGEAAYQWDSLEMTATNEAFHWAGLVHLQRRIYGKPSTHSDVQNAVREIFGALYKVRRGSSAEACLLFPMFTAGCDCLGEKQRVEMLDRIKGVERFGMTQVRNARKLMEKAWETGKPWETLVAGEFFG